MNNSDKTKPASVSRYTALLSEIAVVEISGDDAQEFLSNQLSSDVNNLNPSELQHSSWCDPKGRVLFYLLLAKTESSIYCFVTKDLVEQFCKRLSMFILRAAVKIDPQEKYNVFGINDAEPSQHLNNVFYYPNPSSSVNRCISLVEQDDTEYKTDRQSLSDNYKQWRYDDIVLAHPCFSAAASGAFLPQNLNLDALHGISFSKGCYPGQEIVARLKYRGKVKQRLAVLLTQSDLKGEQPIAPMTAIFSRDEPNKKIGSTLTSQNIDGQTAVSGVVETDFLQNNQDVRIDGLTETFTVSPPPYDIEY